jgi:hypothetical protein
MPATPATIGFDGSIAVTLTGVGDDLGVVDRRKVRTREGQPYHAAVHVPLDEGARLIAQAVVDSAARATDDMRVLLDDVAAAGVSVVRAAVVFKAYRLPTSLEATLRSHTACHAAEGLMTREALCAACDAFDIEVLEVPVDSAIDPRVEGLGKLIGAPWQKTHKAAASAALRALSRST